MTGQYIENHFADIVNYANVIENRLCDEVSKEDLIAENAHNLAQCKAYSLPYILIDGEYAL